MTENREELLKMIWEAEDESYSLMEEYDSLPHHYGEIVLYQAEAYIVNWIGRAPDITITELAERLKKTPSACSQIVRKLVDKGLVTQERNVQNKRVYNLRLTEEGETAYREHIAFNEYCQRITFSMLADFQDHELEMYLKVQKRINEAYMGDIQRSKARFGET